MGEELEDGWGVIVERVTGEGDPDEEAEASAGRDQTQGDLYSKW